MFDTNPSYGQDQAFAQSAQRVADFIWETTGKDLSHVPQSYLETLRYEFSDGRISMLELIDRVDLGPEASYDDYCEVVDALLAVDPRYWPDPEAVESVALHSLPFEIEPDFDFAEDPMGSEAMADGDMSEKMELFLKKVIATTYLDGVTAVTDAEGNPPNMANNYLLNTDGNQFTGIFYDAPPNEQAKKFPFIISQASNGKWTINY